MGIGVRQVVRRYIWALLAVTLLLDAGLGEAAISGCCDVFPLDRYGRWESSYTEPALWLPVGGLILSQSILVLALIRLRPKPTQISVVRGNETA